MKFLKNWLDKQKAKKLAKKLNSQQKTEKTKSTKTLNDLKKRIEKEAYKIAQTKGFNPKYDTENWIKAEEKIMKKIK